MTDYEDLRDWMHCPDVQAAVARQSEVEDIPFELIEAAGRVYILPEPEEPPEQLAMRPDAATAAGRAGA